MRSEICRLEEGHNLFVEYRLSAGKPFPQKPRKCCLPETHDQASWWCHLQSTCFWSQRFPVQSMLLRDPKLDYKNIPRLCTGTGKSTRVSKICSPRRGLPSRGHCKSLTRGWISLSLYKVAVDYFSPTALNPHNKPPLIAFKDYFKTFSALKTAPT